MEARETTFETLLNGRMQYRVPLFQRQYAWQQEQRGQLWSVGLSRRRSAKSRGSLRSGRGVELEEDLVDSGSKRDAKRVAKVTRGQPLGEPHGQPVEKQPVGPGFSQSGYKPKSRATTAAASNGVRQRVR